MPQSGAKADLWMDWCRQTLAAHQSDQHHDPQTNPVKRLAYDLSGALASGHVSVDDLNQLIQSLAVRASLRRADHLRAFHPHTKDFDATALYRDVLKSASHDLTAFRQAIEKTKAGIVFTAHPTFVLANNVRDLIAEHICAATDADRTKIEDQLKALPHGPDGSISLMDEHVQTQRAIAQAQKAVRALNAEILGLAQVKFPNDWCALTPRLLTVASWVGYDLDGRTDIHWAQTIRLRLEEKSEQLRRYANAVADLSKGNAGGALSSLADRLTVAAASAAEEAQVFSADLNDPEKAVVAANRLTDPDLHRLTSLSGVIQNISEQIAKAENDDLKKALVLLRAEMLSYGLGTAHIHLRVNAAQVRSAVRTDLSTDIEGVGFGRVALARASERTRAAKAQAINFANVFLERMTARRQFMLCAQFLKHIDADSPIRFLIAECETPDTVMGAVYLARLYGVADHVDISPLFETPEALERGGRFMERLFEDEEYLAYVRKRGRITIQLGFSDSGRFMGQLAAHLAIERLHILVARGLAERGIRDVDVLIFNTHGESMGRGAHPQSFSARLNHLITPWTRGRFAKEDLSIIHECSFQGGDGFIHFANEQLAQSTVFELTRHALAPPNIDKRDPFYADINFTWDFYRSLKAWQEKLFDDTDYHLTLAAFAPQLLFKTGSRQTRRQTGDAAGTPGPRALRAIPQNAILQQLAMPVNVAGGVGTSIGVEQDRFTDLLAQSPRAKELIQLASHARALTSLPALRGYASLYDASFWVGRSRQSDEQMEASCSARIAARLEDQSVFTSLSRFANLVADDLYRFDDVMKETDANHDALDAREDRTEMHIAHAIRHALMMQCFLLAARLPHFSPRHDLDRDDIIDMIIHLRIPEAVELLDEIFPAALPERDSLAAISEPADQDGDATGGGYPEIQDKIIRPLEALYQSLKNVGIGLSHIYGAYG